MKRNAPRFFAKEIDTYVNEGSSRRNLLTHERFHVFASKSERDGWVAEDDYKTRWDMKGRVRISPTEGRAEYGFAADEDIIFHYDA